MSKYHRKQHKKNFPVYDIILLKSYLGFHDLVNINVLYFLVQFNIKHALIFFFFLETNYKENCMFSADFGTHGWRTLIKDGHLAAEI